MKKSYLETVLVGHLWEEDLHVHTPWNIHQQSIKSQFGSLGSLTNRADAAMFLTMFSDVHISQHPEETPDLKALRYFLYRALAKAECPTRWVEIHILEDCVCIALHRTIAALLGCNPFIFIDVRIVGDELWYKTAVWDEKAKVFRYDDRIGDLFNENLLDDINKFFVESLEIVKMVIDHSLTLYYTSHHRVRRKGPGASLIPYNKKLTLPQKAFFPVHSVARAPPALPNIKWEFWSLNGHFELPVRISPYVTPRRLGWVPPSFKMGKEPPTA